jgi:hypothetical protein
VAVTLGFESGNQHHEVHERNICAKFVSIWPLAFQIDINIQHMPEGLNKDQVEKRLQGMYLLLIICRNHEFCH